MICPVCNNEVGTSPFCPHCGTPMQSAQQQPQQQAYQQPYAQPQQPQYQQPYGQPQQPFNQPQQPQYQQPFNQPQYGQPQGAQPFNQMGVQPAFGGAAPVREKNTKGIIIGIVLAVIAAVIVGAFIILKTGDKKYDLEGFTITMPASLDETDEDTVEELLGNLSSLESQGYEINKGAYENNDMAFAYVSVGYEKSDHPENFADLTPEQMIDVFEQQMKFSPLMEVVSTDGDTLEYTYKDLGGDSKEAHYKVLCAKENGTFFIFVFGCEDDDWDKYESKFDKYLDSVDYD